MVLNLYDKQLSYVINPRACLHKFQCASCERHFNPLPDWKRHQGSCASATQYEFPGKTHKMTPTIFDRLEEFDIVVPTDGRLYLWFIVYDFEAILSRLEEDAPTPHLPWLRKHEPISVSVASNVGGFEEAWCFVNLDPKVLIEEMMTYMGSIAESARDKAESQWSSAMEDLDNLIEKYENKLGKESKRKRKKKPQTMWKPK